MDSESAIGCMGGAEEFVPFPCHAVTRWKVVKESRERGRSITPSCLALYGTLSDMTAIKDGNLFTIRLFE